MINPQDICMNCMNKLNQSKGVCTHCGFDNATCANDAHQLESGSILAGSYIIGKVLGQGGFGITYVGWDLNLEIKVAIKEYYPEGCVTRDTHTHVSVLTYAGPKDAFFQKGKERFVGEARALAKFSGDSGVVGVRAFFYENGTAYIVMDFVEGETLKAYAARIGGKMPSAQVLSLFQPLIRSLARVHESGLLHRDISPDNIMLKPDGTLALLDFGAARQISVAGEHSNTINVKHGYAPEEQYRTRGEQGPWTDVYALCATIYRLTTGVTPTEALDRMANEEQLVKPNVYGADFTPQQEAALMQGLSLRAKERIRSMQELANELNQEVGTDLSLVQPTQESQSAATNADDAWKEVITHPNATDDAAQENSKEQAGKSEGKVKAITAKKVGIILASAAALVMVIIVSATMIQRQKQQNELMIQRQTQQNELKQISDEINAKNYTSALAIAESIKLKNADYDEAIYGYTLNMIDKGEVDTAETMKDLIVDASAFDMVPVEDGITIGRIRNYLSSGNYEQAEVLLPKIQKPGSINLIEIEIEIASLRIEALVKNKSYEEAVSEILSLEKIDQEAASELISKYSSKFYDYAISLYRKGNINDAEPVFLRLKDYQRTSDYILLIECSKGAKPASLYWGATHDQVINTIGPQLEKLALIADFENAGELLLTNTNTAFLFLLGEWRGGPAYIKFYIRDKKWWGSWQISGIPRGTWNFTYSDFYLTDSKGARKKIAHFTVIDQNTIEIFVYASERTYSLKRT